MVSLAVSLWCVAAGVAGVGAPAPVVRVGFDASVCPHAVSGRLVVLMKAKEGAAAQTLTPLDGPDWEHEQPLFAVDVKNLAPGAWADVGEEADAFPAAMGALPPGEYVVQARLDTQRTDSNWRREEGNLYTSGRAALVVAPGAPAPEVRLKLDAVTHAPERARVEGVEWFAVRSALLSDFRGRDVVLRAGVVLPTGYDAGATYAAVYEVPGFGGNDQDAAAVAQRRREEPDAALNRSTFWIVLDPEGPNGHTLFCDSANNGPCGRALVEELIPALEKKFPLVARPEARLLRGHSSGGWSTLWLATEYPSVFGACWSSSPDPVDFRRFQLCDIYACHWFYGFPLNGLRSGEAQEAERWARTVPQGLVPAPQTEGPSGFDRLVSFRNNGRAVMTVEREAKGEDLLGPDNTSGQQWDSWFAAWGPRNARGNPAALYDPRTGLLDPAVAAQYRRYDIADRLRRDAAKYGDTFRLRVRLVVGDADNFFLNEAVSLLRRSVDALPGPRGPGYIVTVPGADHSTVFASAPVKAFGGEMAEHLRGAGLLRATK